jgi:16S rRNA G966 N2-methylase RsmD
VVVKKHWTDDFFVKAAFYKADDGIVMCCAADTVLRDSQADSIDLVFTDPDYTKGDLRGYNALALYAPRIMREHATLIVEAPQKYLPSILFTMQTFGSLQNLRWRWEYGFSYHTGPQKRLAMGIRCMKKPLLCYSKGTWKNRGFVKDEFPVEYVKKAKHKWQKNLDGYKYYIERHTDENDIVLDCFAGSGTTAFACRELGRRFVIVDIGSECCKQIAEDLQKG